jgi:PleD family two-component response regulator
LAYLVCFLLAISGNAVSAAWVEAGDLRRKGKRALMARIVVIDDDGDITSILRRILEREGHDVLVASDGVEGLQVCRQTRPEAAITDIIMPEKEGFETIRELHFEFPDMGNISKEMNIEKREG